jgi:peptide/nickel transport system substrate-binding protein
MAPGDEQVDRLVGDYLERRVDRRGFLKRAGALGLSLSAASALLAACGGDEEAAAPPAEAPPAEPPPATTEPAATEPAATEPAVTEPAATGPSEASGTLRIHLNNDIINLDNAFYPAGADELASQGVYEGLITYKPGTWEVVNVLAETFEPSADGLQYAFKLKEGIQFHGGYGEVTAEDVKYSYERIAGLTTPKLDSPYQGDWAALQEVRVDDTYSGTIILKEPFAALMTTTLPVFSGVIHSKKAVEELGEEYATHPISTGPYEFVEWKPKQHVRLQRFADYSGAASEFIGTLWDELLFIPIEEENAKAIAIESDEIDFVNVGPATVSQFEGNEDFTIHDRVTLNYNWIGMNILNPKLEDINVRQAIRYAIDVPAILEAGFEGRYERATAIIPPGMPIGYWEDAPVYERDLDQANQFLSQAASPPSELSITFTEETGSNEVAEIVQANLAEIGITVTPNKLDSSAYYALEPEELQSRELFYIGFITQPDPSWSTVWFVCDQIDVWNWMYWCDEEYDRLHYAALQESDPAARHDMYIQMQERWDAGVHTVWTHWPTEYFVARPTIEPAIRPDGRVQPTGFRAV